jgi:hypothetical protein
MRRLKDIALDQPPTWPIDHLHTVFKLFNDFFNEFQIISIENLKYWNGSLLNFTVSCRKDNKKESYCVLLKLKSLPTYSQVSNKPYRDFVGNIKRSK